MIFDILIIREIDGSIRQLDNPILIVLVDGAFGVVGAHHQSIGRL